MKINCQRESLTNAFALAASIAPARSPKEILQNVKVTASGGKIILTATDMEVGLKTVGAATVHCHSSPLIDCW